MDRFLAIARPPFAMKTLAALALLAGSAAVPQAEAAAPRVQFDVPLVIPCADVTSDEFIAQHPGHRLLEATFEISSLVSRGTEADLVEYIYRFVSPRSSVRVADYRDRKSVV